MKKSLIIIPLLLVAVFFAACSSNKKAAAEADAAATEPVGPDFNADSAYSFCALFSIPCFICFCYH